MILGFIKNNCKDFTDPVALKTLFTSLEYNSAVWSSYIKYQIHSLDNIQNRFLRFLAFKCHITREPHSPYQPLNHISFHIVNLREKRKIDNLKL